VKRLDGTSAVAVVNFANDCVVGSKVCYPTVLLIDRNYSVSMMLAVQPTLEFVSIPHNVTYLTGFITGSEIGLHGNTPSVVASAIF